MNHSPATLLLISLLASTAAGAQAQGSVSVPAGGMVQPAGNRMDASAETPAQRRVASARQQLQADPKKVQALNDLALAYISRARETEDPTYYKDAAQALMQGLAFDPKDFQLQKTQVALLLGQKQYTAAKEQATVLHRHTPDDVMIYGYLAEAEIGLGDLAAAEKNAQWMLNMRPNNVPGLLLGATLRARYGQDAGALEFLKVAYAETSPTEVEELAWIANQIASVQIDSGHPQDAVPTLARAEQLFPGYPYTRQNLARVRALQAEGKAPSDAAQATQAATSLSNPLASLENPRPAPGAKNVAFVLAPRSFSPVPQTLLTPLPTGTARSIRNAQSAVAGGPKDAQAYAALGAAYMQQARETGDVDDYDLAEKSLDVSLGIVSSDFAAEAPLETLAEVCMGEHRFADALTDAQKALSLGSGDVSPFAIVGDADADMGEYAKAGLAYARLTPPDMTLAPHAAYARDSRTAYLSFIAGNTAEAVRLMEVAVSEGIEAQLPQENLAWLYYELGEFLTQSGDALSANAAYLTALQIHPGDYRALAGLAKLRANSGRYAEAIVLYQRAIAVVPMPIFVGELGDLYARTGDQVEAKKQYQLVEYIGLLGKINQVLHNRDLALFYADHDIKLPEALALAQKEFEVRHDIYTWDALGWALYKNGKYTEAKQASDKSLQQGTRDAMLWFHAGMIAEKLGDVNDATKDLKLALAINPNFQLRYADVARQHLAALNTQLASGAPTAPHAH